MGIGNRMRYGAIVFRVHALKRMHERSVSIEAVRAVLEKGETIAAYPEDKPYPSRLLLGWDGSRPLHIVVAEVAGTQEVIVITVYEPDKSIWDDDYRTRRRK
ncbi:MAG: DUF4258 domain-containing protein [Candidatus Geothermincolia bacterium]